MSFISYLNFLICRFKNNGNNFRVNLATKERLVLNASVPEDLVQIQAYIRWERKGKQMYTPEQEKACEICSLFLQNNCYHFYFSLYCILFFLSGERNFFAGSIFTSI